MVKKASTRACFVFNASANAGKAERKRKFIKESVTQHWPCSAWLETTEDEVCWNKLEKMAAHFDLLVACGGDGTVHNTGNIAIELDCALGVIPLGSGNDFAAMNQIPESAGEAVSVLKRNYRKKVDVIRCSGDLNCWCLNTAGIGLDGLANTFTQIYKQKIGKLGYIAGALKAAMCSKPFNVTLRIDGMEEKPLRLLMLTACIGFREGGRFIVAPEAKNSDGKMILLQLSPMPKTSLIAALPQFISQSPVYPDEVRHVSCREIVIATEKAIYIHADGEHTGKTFRRVSLRVHHKKLEIVTGHD